MKRNLAVLAYVASLGVASAVGITAPAPVAVSNRIAPLGPGNWYPSPIHSSAHKARRRARVARNFK